MLVPLHGSCVRKADGWWTHEVCFGTRVRQYHKGAEGKEEQQHLIGTYDEAASAALESAGEALVDTARTEQADLVVLGAQLRNVDGRPFIGHTVEAVLERSDATVVVVAQPRPKDPPTGE